MKHYAKMIAEKIDMILQLGIAPNHILVNPLSFKEEESAPLGFVRTSGGYHYKQIPLLAIPALEPMEFFVARSLRYGDGTDFSMENMATYSGTRNGLIGMCRAMLMLSQYPPDFLLINGLDFMELGKSVAREEPDGRFMGMRIYACKEVPAHHYSPGHFIFP